MFWNFGLVLQNELSGWCFNERSKGIYASCVLRRKLKIYFPIFLFNTTFEPLYKPEVMHVKYLAEIGKGKTMKRTSVQLDLIIISQKNQSLLLYFLPKWILWFLSFAAKIYFLKVNYLWKFCGDTNPAVGASFLTDLWLEISLHFSPFQHLSFVSYVFPWTL